jgi:diguanylate cyclase (GGDEF)-like protein
MGDDLVPIDFLISPVLDASGKVVGLLPTAVDITERKQLEEALKRQAHLDYLTGLSNRRHFMEQAEVELSRAVRYDITLSILMLDIDHFKRVNDTYGHQSGDTVLRILARVCQEVLRNFDIIGRLGGEEFAVILPETDIEQTLEVAERLREVIADTEVSLPDGGKTHFTVSIGVSTLSDKNSNIDSLLNQADKALYKAKESGRNMVCVASK